jgi:hypothetical protein
MRVDPLLPRWKRHTIVLEAVGDEQARVNHSSLDSPLVILADQALEVVNIEGQLRVAPARRSAEYLNVDPMGFSAAGYGPTPK